MAAQFLLQFNSERDSAAAQEYLESLQLSESEAFENGNPQLFHAAPSDATSLMCQCRATAGVSADATISGGALAKEIPFADVFYQVSAVKSARHHPDGMLWIRRPSKTHVLHEEKLSLQQVAPMILDLFDVGPALLEPAQVEDAE